MINNSSNNNNSSSNNNISSKKEFTTKEQDWIFLRSAFSDRNLFHKFRKILSNFSQILDEVQSRRLCRRCRIWRRRYRHRRSNWQRLCSVLHYPLSCFRFKHFLSVEGATVCYGIWTRDSCRKWSDHVIRVKRVQLVGVEKFSFEVKPWYIDSLPRFKPMPSTHQLFKGFPRTMLQQFSDWTRTCSVMELVGS